MKETIGSSHESIIQEVIIPSGPFSSHSHTHFSGQGFEHILRDVLERDEIGRSIPFVDSALVIVKDYIHDPVQGIETWYSVFKRKEQTIF